MACIRYRTIAFCVCVIGAVLLPACESSGDTEANEGKFGELSAEIAAGNFPKTTGVLVEQGGRIVFEKYFGDGAPDRLNDTRSATKTLVAFAVGAAIAEGSISSVDTPVWPFFADGYPEVTQRARSITFRDLLTMTSSRHCDDNNDTPGNEENMYPEESWTAFFWSLPDAPDWARADDGLGPWRYCTAGSFILGQAVERATGAPIDQYIDAKILTPLEITRVAWDRSPSGEVQTGGGAEFTLRDLGKLIRLIVNKGEWNGEQVLSADWIEEMTTVRRLAFGDMSYGYQIWNRQYPTPCGAVSAWFMAGNGGNHALAFPDKDLVIVVTREFYNSRGMHQQTNDMVERLLLPALVCL